MEFLAKNPIVIDNGSGVTKAGFSGEDKPQLIFPSYVGRPKYKPVLPSGTQSEYQIKIQKEEQKGLLKLKYPMSHGIITNWEDMDLIWKYVFSELKASPKENPVLLTEPPLNPINDKFKMAQIFFESYSVPAFFVAVQGILSLFASGKTTGVVLDSGDGVTQCVPIFDGFSLNHAALRVDLAGRDITEYLNLLIRRSGFLFHTSAEFEIVKKIKEKRCALSPSSQSDEKLLGDKIYRDPYILPDGNVLELSSEKYRAPEILFSPEKVGLEMMALPELLLSSINKADIDLRKTLYSDVVLAGGTTLLQGFPERFMNEIRKLVPKEIKISLYVPQERNLLCWVGGSILSNLTSFKHMWINRKVLHNLKNNKKEYDEEGERMLLKKTF